MAGSARAAAPAGLGATDRRDAWWLHPLAIGIGLAGFIVYATWAAFQGEDYLYTVGGAHYRSPFYSPDLTGVFGLDWLPAWVPRSPAFLILWAPAGFRITCYYFRKAYYRAYGFHPPACAVGEAAHRGYRGERGLPWILNNLHRYFMYCAVVLVVIHWWDSSHAFLFEDGIGMGVGSLVLLVDAILLTGYVFGCHSLRHLVGGGLDCFSCGLAARARHRVWKGVSVLNTHHPFWAWSSLFMVGFADFYVRMLSMGVWSDVRFF